MNIAQLGLATLREGLTIIPQEIINPTNLRSVDFCCNTDAVIRTRFYFLEA